MKVRKVEEKGKIIARDINVWLGLDVHGKNTEVVVMDAEEVIHRESVPTKREHFVALGKRFDNCKVRAVYEASAIGYKPLRWLHEGGLEAFMTPPALIPQRKGEYVKTDRRDAVKLARCLRGQMLDPVWALTDQQYADRQLVRTRKQLVGHRTRCSQQIKSMLKFHGIQRPDGLKANWSRAYLEWLESGPSDQPSINDALEVMVECRRSLSKHIRKIDRQVRELAKSDRYKEEVRRLRTAPGVGRVVAMTFLVELGDVVERFDTCEEFSSFLGLAPSESSSASSQSKGGLPKKGNKWVRTELIQAAWTTKGADEQLGAVYDRIRRRNKENGAGVAIVAVARRLALALRAMLREQKDWREPSSGQQDA